MVKLLVSDDYAVLETGGWRFYYGYEETPIGRRDFNADDDLDWAFVAKRKNEVIRIAARALSGDKFECAEQLLRGIGTVLEMDKDA